MLPTEGVGWKEAIAVVSGCPQRQQRREGPWNESSRVSCLLLVCYNRLEHCAAAARAFGQFTAIDAATNVRNRRIIERNALLVGDGPGIGAGHYWVVQRSEQACDDRASRAEERSRR